MLKRATDSQFLRFAVAGGIAALANIASRYLLSKLMLFEIAVVLAYGVGIVVAFLLTRYFVYNAADGNLFRQFYRFVLVNLLAAAQVFAVSVLLYRIVFPWLGMTWHADTVAHVIAVASPIVVSFFLHKHYSFRED